MKLEDQVVSLELAKKLKELGVQQDSYFMYFPIYDHHSGTAEVIEWRLVCEKNEIHGSEIISAFTVAELGEMLKDYDLECVWFEGEQAYGAFQTNSGVDTCYGRTEAEARAKLLVYLLESKLMEVKDE